MNLDKATRAQLLSIARAAYDVVLQNKIDSQVIFHVFSKEDRDKFRREKYRAMMKALEL
jgi:hypothetical protein